MINTAIVFDHRGRTKKGERGPLEVRVTVSRKPYYINTGIRVCANEWKYGAVMNRADAPELNERLRILVSKVEREINYCIENDMAVDVAQIRRNILDVEQSSSHEVVDWMQERISMMPLAKGTISHYTTMLDKFVEYGMMKRWTDMTTDAIYRWNAWLHLQDKPQTKAQRRMGLPPEKLSDAGIYNYHKTLKRLLTLAEKAQLIHRNPYSLLKGEFKRGDHENVEYLTENEINAIRNLRLQRGSHLDMVRDLFVMQIYTGMAYADLMKFDAKNYREVDGKWIANDDRVKSGVAFIAHLLPPVVEVLNKYEWQVPQIANQVYNRSLKKIGELAGIEMNLHTHLGRHTFGTFMLANGVQIQNLQRMMGHKDIKQTLRYAKTLAESVHGDFDMIAEKLK